MSLLELQEVPLTDQLVFLDPLRCICSQPFWGDSREEEGGNEEREMARGVGKMKREVGTREKGRNEEWLEDGKRKKREGVDKKRVVREREFKIEKQSLKPTICQTCRILSSETLHTTHASFGFQVKSDIFAV